MPLTIIANIRAKVGSESLVHTALAKLVNPTRAEEGCIQYDLHRDNENPAHFLFYETWESRELWQTHMNAPHLAAYLSETDGAVEDFTINEMDKVA